MKRTLLVLGGAPDQCHLINTAHQMGLWVVCMDQNPDAPGMALADEAIPISTRDVRVIVNYLWFVEPIHGVLTMGSDVTQTVAEVCKEFNLPGPSLKCAHYATNKLAQKACLQAAGVPTPALLSEDSVVVKPIYGSGSKGVFCHTGDILLEEYVPGPQVSTEVVLWDDKAKVVALADRNYDQTHLLPRVVENGGQMPSRFTGEDLEAIEKLTIDAARAIGITRGTAKADIVWGPDGPVVLEVHARLSGGYLCDGLAMAHNGVNYVKAAILIANGKEPDWDDLQPKFPPRPVYSRYENPETREGFSVRIGPVPL